MTEGPYFGYHWQFSVTVVAPALYEGTTAAEREAAFDARLPEGIGSVVVLNTECLPVVAAEHVVGQCQEVAPLAQRLLTGVVLSPRLRALGQAERAEWYRSKAEDCRQGVADRLWRDRLLENDPEARVTLTQWVHDFGAEQAPLHAEESAHTQAMFRAGLGRRLL